MWRSPPQQNEQKIKMTDNTKATVAIVANVATPYASEIAGANDVISVITSVVIALITLWKTIKKSKPRKDFDAVKGQLKSVEEKISKSADTGSKKFDEMGNQISGRLSSAFTKLGGVIAAALLLTKLVILFRHVLNWLQRQMV